MAHDYFHMIYKNICRLFLHCFFVAQTSDRMYTGWSFLWPSCRKHAQARALHAQAPAPADCGLLPL